MPEQNKDDDWALEAARNFAASSQGVGLKIPVEAVAEVFRQFEVVDVDLSGIDRVYSTEETAQFLGKSPQWMYWAMNSRERNGGGQFYYSDGRPIEPQRVGRKQIRKFTLPLIKEMAVSMHRQGTVDLTELETIVRRIQLARLGRWQPTAPKKTTRRKPSTQPETPDGPPDEGKP